MKKSGQIRHLGFSAHSVEAALTALARFPFDSILLPINFATYLHGNFGPTVIAAAQKKGVSLLALKALARQNWPTPLPSQSPSTPSVSERAAFPKCWYQPLTDPREQSPRLALHPQPTRHRRHPPRRGVPLLARRRPRLHLHPPHPRRNHRTPDPRRHPQPRLCGIDFLVDVRLSGP